MSGTFSKTSSRSTWTLAVACCCIFPGMGELAQAGNYLIDPNYAGVEGAPLGAYAGAYKSIVTALNTVSNPLAVPAGASAANPNRIFFAPGTYNTANVTGATLVNQRNNIALVGLTGNPN